MGKELSTRTSRLLLARPLSSGCPLSAWALVGHPAQCSLLPLCVCLSHWTHFLLHTLPALISPQCGICARSTCPLKTLARWSSAHTPRLRTLPFRRSPRSLSLGRMTASVIKSASTSSTWAPARRAPQKLEHHVHRRRLLLTRTSLGASAPPAVSITSVAVQRQTTSALLLLPHSTRTSARTSRAATCSCSLLRSSALLATRTPHRTQIHSVTGRPSHGRALGACSTRPVHAIRAAQHHNPIQVLEIRKARRYTDRANAPQKTLTSSSASLKCTSSRRCTVSRGSHRLTRASSRCRGALRPLPSPLHYTRSTISTSLLASETPPHSPSLETETETEAKKQDAPPSP
jgi:hypothetical protein